MSPSASPAPRARSPSSPSSRSSSPRSATRRSPTATSPRRPCTSRASRCAPQRGLAGDAALDPRARRGHPAPGQAPPREASRPGQHPPRDRSLARPDRLTAPGRACPDRYPETLMARGHHRPRPAPRRGRASSRSTSSGSRRSTVTSPSSSCSTTPRSASDADELRQRAREDDEPLDELLPEAFALVREAGKRALGQRHYDVQLIGGMVLDDGAIAEMKTGEGKTLTATAAGVPEHARRRRRPPGHRQRLPRPPRRALDEADLRPARRLGRRDPVGDEPGAAAPDVRGRRHLRDQLRVRLRLPARQHGELARGVRAARARVRDRRRGRQHPDRRGPHPADHLRPPRAGRRHLLHVRPPGEADGRRGDEAEAEVARRVARHLRGRARLRVRREAQDRRPDRGAGSTRPRSSSASTTSTSPSTGRSSTT